MSRRSKFLYALAALAAFVLTGCIGVGSNQNSQQPPAAGQPAATAPNPSAEKLEEAPGASAGSNDAAIVPPLPSVTWEGDAGLYLEATVEAVTRATQQDSKLRGQTPQARLVTESRRGIRCSTRPDIVIDGNEPDQKKAPIAWCSSETAQKLYAGEAALRTAAEYSTAHAQMLIIHALGEYAIDQYGYELTPATSACATGHLVWLIHKDGVLSDEEAIALRALLPDVNMSESFRNGYYNRMSACKPMP